MTEENITPFSTILLHRWILLDIKSLSVKFIGSIKMLKNDTSLMLTA